ncbi:MAG: PEP-CTERM sorting domain-containing protein [Akkermansiaceae bacterium]
MINYRIHRIAKHLALATFSLSALPVISATTTFDISSYGTITSTSSTTPLALREPERTGAVSFTPNSYDTSIYALLQTSVTGLPGSGIKGNNELRYGYFEFGLFGITKPITSATFEIFLPANGLTGSADSITQTQSVQLRVSDFNPTSFVAMYDGEAPPSFDTLQLVADASFSPADQGSMLVLNFSPEGINYLNTEVANGTPFLKFITEITSTGYPFTQPSSNQVVYRAGVFENSDTVVAVENLPRLIVTEVPEPSSITLLGLGFFTLLLSRRRY